MPSIGKSLFCTLALAASTFASPCRSGSKSGSASVVASESTVGTKSSSTIVLSSVAANAAARASSSAASSKGKTTTSKAAQTKSTAAAAAASSSSSSSSSSSTSGSRTTAPSGCITVSGDSTTTGEYTTLSSALASLSGSSDACIFMYAGTYEEQVTVDYAGALTIYGYTTDTSSYENNQVTITHTITSSEAGTLDKSSTMDITSSSFTMYNINVVNGYGSGSQAVAVTANGDEQGYYGCSFDGYQDTLYAKSGTQYYSQCYIGGATDYIFGDAAAWFDECTIASKGQGYITANSRETEDDTTWYVFNKCTITTADDATGDLSGLVYLGRPWRVLARVMYQYCSLSDIINSAGWTTMADGATPVYEEYENTGDGSDTSDREYETTASSAVTMDTLYPDGYDWIDTSYPSTSSSTGSSASAVTSSKAATSSTKAAAKTSAVSKAATSSSKTTKTSAASKAAATSSKTTKSSAATKAAASSSKTTKAAAATASVSASAKSSKTTSASKAAASATGASGSVCTPTAGGSSSTDDTPAIESAIAACPSGTILIPAGTTYYLNTALSFDGCEGCTMELEGTLQASDDTDYWNGVDAIVTLSSITGATIISKTGTGVFDGNGQASWDLFASDSSYARATMMVIAKSSNVVVENIYFKDAPNVFHSCNGDSTNVAYNNITLYAVSSSDNVAKNTDGWDIGPASYVTVNGATVTNDDDCIAFKHGASYVTVLDITCTGSHGLSVGSLGSKEGQTDTVSNIYVSGATMISSSKAAGIKLYPGGYGTAVVSNVTWENIVVKDCDYAFQVQSCYSEDDSYCESNPSTGTLTDIVVNGLSGTTSSDYAPNAININCPASGTCGITMSDITVEADGGTTEYLCANTESSIGIDCTDGASG